MRWRVLALTAALLAFVIVPFVLWGEPIEQALRSWLAQPHAVDVTALVIAGTMAADVVLPIPSSLVAVSAGVALGWAWGAAALTIGATIGAAVGYALGRFVGAAGLSRWIDASSRQALSGYFARYGVGTLVMLRAVPVLAEASVIAAGAARMAVLPFALACTASNLVIALVYAIVGDWGAKTGHVETALLAGLVLPGIALVFARRR